jgi:hypothetical protein
MQTLLGVDYSRRSMVFSSEFPGPVTALLTNAIEVCRCEVMRLRKFPASRNIVTAKWCEASSKMCVHNLEVECWSNMQKDAVRTLAHTTHQPLGGVQMSLSFSPTDL